MNVTTERNCPIPLPLKYRLLYDRSCMVVRECCVAWWFSRHASKPNYHASFTQVKNKIAYHSINWVKKLKYRRRVIHKQRAKVSGMCDIQNTSYSAKGSTENYSGAPLRDSNIATGNQWKHLETTLALSKRFFSLLNKAISRYFRERRVHVTQKQCRCCALWKKNKCSIFKTKQSKTSKQIYV